MTKYKNPALTVDTIIIEDNKVILIKRLNNPFKDHWAIPGGFVEYGEKVEDAAVREAKEETGLDIELTKLLPTFIYLLTCTKKYINSLSLIFLLFKFLNRYLIKLLVFF